MGLRVPFVLSLIGPFNCCIIALIFTYLFIFIYFSDSVFMLYLHLYSCSLVIYAHNKSCYNKKAYTTNTFNTTFAERDLQYWFAVGRLLLGMRHLLSTKHWWKCWHNASTDLVVFSGHFPCSMFVANANANTPLSTPLVCCWTDLTLIFCPSSCSMHATSFPVCLPICHPALLSYAIIVVQFTLWSAYSSRTHPVKTSTDG